MTVSQFCTESFLRQLKDDDLWTVYKILQTVSESSKDEVEKCFKLSEKIVQEMINRDQPKGKGHDGWFDALPLG